MTDLHVSREQRLNEREKVIDASVRVCLVGEKNLDFGTVVHFVVT